MIVKIAIGEIMPKNTVYRDNKNRCGFKMKDGYTCTARKGHLEKNIPHISSGGVKVVALQDEEGNFVSGYTSGKVTTLPAKVTTSPQINRYIIQSGDKYIDIDDKPGPMSSGYPYEITNIWYARPMTLDSARLLKQTMGEDAKNWKIMKATISLEEEPIHEHAFVSEWLTEGDRVYRYCDDKTCSVRQIGTVKVEE